MNIPKTPKLRGRQQLTLRYKAYEKELAYWTQQLTDMSTADHVAAARTLRFLSSRVADCEARLDELAYVMGGVV